MAEKTYYEILGVDKTAGIGFGNLFETDHKVFLERGQNKLIHS